MMKLVCLLLAVACASIEANQLVANQYVDALMKDFPQLAGHLGLDPMTLPNQQASFSKKIVLVKVKGSASLTNGRLTGLSTLRRSGDFIVGHAGTRAFIDGSSLAVSNLRGSYTGSAKFMGVGVSIGASVGIGSIRIRIRVSCDVAPGSVANLDNFNIAQMSSIDVKINGLGVIGWALGSILSVVANSLRGVISNAVEGPIRNALRGQVGKVTFPKF